MNILGKLLIVVLALLLVEKVVVGISIDGLYTALIIAVLLGLTNAIIKPILLILTLPITILTLGLSTFVINALLFWFIADFVEGFEVAGFLSAFLGALIVSVFSWIGNRIF